MSSTHGSGGASGIRKLAVWVAAAACTVGAVLLTVAVTSESPARTSATPTADARAEASAQSRFVPVVVTITPTVPIPDLCDAAYCDAFGDPFSHASCTLNTLICGGPEVTPSFGPSQ